MNRWIAAVVVATVLGGLLVWQQNRARLMAICVEAGGLWNGATSSCAPAPGRPILQRDLHRT